MSVQLRAAGNLGKGIRTAGWCIVVLGLVAASFTGSAAAENTTQTTLSVATKNAGPRSTFSLSAHVSAIDPEVVPSGVVNFRSGDADLGSALLDSEGNASLDTDILPAGSHQVVAIYQGAPGYQSSLSSRQSLQAEVSTVAGFTVAASPTSLSTAVGGFVNSSVIVTPINGFNAYVSLSCKGLPVNTTCTFTPVNVLASCTAGAGGAETCTPGTSVMQIQTQSPSPGTNVANGSSGAGMLRYGFLFPALFGLAGLAGRRRRAWRHVALAALVFAGAMGMTACNPRYNYLNHGPPDNQGTPAGNYTVTVEAQSSIGAQTTTPPALPQITLTITAAKNQETPE